jgi:hypothetical protein
VPKGIKDFHKNIHLYAISKTQSTSPFTDLFFIFASDTKIQVG